MRTMAIKCPYCNHEGMPFVEKKIATEAWIIFAILLFVCFPLCWIPFVVDSLKEEVVRCHHCGFRIN
ncbi:hypothetical protein EMN47_00645 [Prolixibacteraceae bacterium JC049]|nr:hypothetical protein [Prolixibacteraceae bacterium JC049]